jgi:hypothetical protein
MRKRRCMVNLSITNIAKIGHPPKAIIFINRFSRAMIHIRQPGLEETSGNFVMSPFTSGLWWTIFLTVITIIFVFAFDWIIRLKNGLQKSEDLPSSLFFIFSIFCQQGEYWTRRNHISRTFVTLLNSCSTVQLIFSYESWYDAHDIGHHIKFAFFKFQQPHIQIR